MMFLLKLAFWAIILLLLLPGSREEKQALYGIAEKTAGDLYAFCTRNPDVCDETKTAFHLLVQKVRVGAEMVEEMVSRSDGAGAEAKPLQDRLKGDGSLPARPADEILYKSQNTLSNGDLAPEWRRPGT